MFSLMKSMALAAVVAASGLLLATSSSKAETQYVCRNYSQVLSLRVEPSLCDPNRERVNHAVHSVEREPHKHDGRCGFGKYDKKGHKSWHGLKNKSGIHFARGKFGKKVGHSTRGEKKYGKRRDGKQNIGFSKRGSRDISRSYTGKKSIGRDHKARAGNFGKGTGGMRAKGPRAERGLSRSMKDSRSRGKRGADKSGFNDGKRGGSAGKPDGVGGRRSGGRGFGKG